ncbi:MAG: hypothetical protein J6R83_02445, partial [Clostridia bacterium]|nr:hypothetical protein [Clostridia bacterium]
VNVTSSINTPSFANSYYINSDYKFVSRWIENGEKRNCVVAENDTELYGEVTTTYGYRSVAYVKGLMRYDTYAQLPTTAGLYDSYNTEVWDLTKGYPVFKSVEKYALVQDVKANAEFYAGGAKDVYEINLENTDTQGISIYANYNTTVYKPILTIVEGEQIVTVENEVIKPVAGASGEATVKAVYDIQGVAVEKVYTIKVVLPALGYELRYSTMTNELFVENNKIALNDIDSIIDFADQTKVYYNDKQLSSAIAKNYTTEKLEDITSAVIVTLANGEMYSANLVSYTLVINEDTDLALFNEANYATYSVEGHDYASYYTTASSKPILRGYYIVNNDIYLSGNWAGNTHDYNNKNGSFGGTFDGDGHVVELRLRSGGLFGALYGATVKNVAFVAKELSSSTVSSGRYSILANQTWSASSDWTIIDNVYATYDLDVAVTTKYQSYGRASGISFISHNGYYVRYTNSILDFSDLEIADMNDLGSYGFANAVIGTATEKDGFREGTTNNYFITSLPTAGRTLEVSNNAYTGNVYTTYGANQTELYNADTTSTYKYQYKGISVYADYATMKAANHDYSSYNTDVWTIAQGEVPVFTAYAKYVLANSVAKDAKLYFAGAEGQTSTELKIGEQVSAYATYQEQPYQPTLKIIAGNSVSVEGATITAVTYGASTVLATYTIDGVEITATYTVEVLIPEYNAQVLYSTLDNKLYLPDFKQDVVSIVNAGDNTVYYEDGAHANISANNTNEAVTVKSIVTLEDGAKYYIDVISYTKVLTTAQDFVMFNIETETTIITGCYALANDITTKETVYFTHHGLHGADSELGLTNTTNWDYTGAGFAGTFDGLGHVVTMDVKGTIGIFGQFQSGAKVQNVAFYDMTIGSYRDGYATNANGELVSKSNSGRENWNTLLASGAQNNVRNVYITDVFAEITEISAKGTWGSGFISSPGYINMTGVVVKFDPTISNLHGAIHAYNPGNDRNKSVIAITTQYLSRNGDTRWVGINENLTSDTITYKTVKNVYRYADYLSLANDTDNHEAMYANFSTEYWSFTKGFPVFKGLEERANQAYINSANFYFAGSEGETETTVDNSEASSFDLHAIFNSTTYEPTLAIVSGETVTVSGKTISTIANSVGTSVVKATYVINGVTVEKEYTIVVNPQEKAGKISYSTLDNQVYLSDEIKEDQIDKIIDLATGDVWYEEGMPTEKMLQNTDKNDLAEVTKKVVVFLEDGSNYSIELVSYTKVLTTSKDFEVFYTTESSGVISGYYIMANDIYLDGTWSGNGVKSTDNPHKFTGVFDGNGHFAEIALKRYGIFGTIVGTSAQRVEIKDAAFIVKQLGVKDFAYASILAYRMNYATVSNCYFEYDLPEGTKIDTGYYGWGQSSGLGIYATTAVEVRFNNVIIDTSKVETECVTYEQPFSFGSIATKADCSSSGAYLTKTTDVYVISTNKYMSYYADVTASSGKVTAFNGIKYAWF